MKHRIVLWILWMTVVFIVYGFYGSYFLFLLLILSAITPVLLFISIRIIKNKVDYKFLPTDAVIKSHGAKVELNIKNRGLLPILNGKAYIRIYNVLTKEERYTDFYFTILGWETETVSLEIESKYCGNIEVSLEKIIYFDYFGIFTTCESVEEKTAFNILPNTFPILIDFAKGAVEDIEGVSYSSIKKGYDTSEIFSIREYMPGDGLKNIHWKVTSKLNKLFVKEASLPIQNGILIFLDTSIIPDMPEEHPEVGDGMMEVLVSVSQAMADRGVSHSIGWFDYDYNRVMCFDIPTLDELSGLTPGLLGIRRNEDINSGLYQYFSLIQRNSFAHIVYITARNTEEEIRQIKEGCNITVLHCYVGETERPSENMEVLFSPQNPQGDLQELII